MPQASLPTTCPDSNAWAGCDVIIVEAQTQIMLREQLGGHVPVPEISSQADGELLGIRPSLIEGGTLLLEGGRLKRR